jgi:hypothetical protein
LWDNGTNFAEAAFLIINTGGRDIVMDNIAVRGQECNWTNVYYNKTTSSISADLTYVTPTPTSTLVGQRWDPTKTYNFTFTRGISGQNMILRSGWSMIVYVTNPDDVSVSDIGVTVGVTIFTANAQYYKEANVQASA